MAAADVQAPPPTEPAPGVPDYLASPNAVFGDADVKWRYGKAPDYSKTRKVWEEGKKSNHAAGSLPQLVENLVKNWEVEASFKPRLEDWRTIDHENYTFAINGGPPQSAEHMLEVGTYNAIIAPNEYYSPANSDFASSHKTFKRMMPTFAWEVTEVYSGPPKVAFKWRHWGVMKNDYVGFNDKGEKIVAKAHGGPIEIYGVTVAQVDDKVRLQSVDTWFDPIEMFRQIAPAGIVNRTPMNRKVDPEAALDDEATAFAPADPKAEDPSLGADGISIAKQHNEPGNAHSKEVAPEDVIPKHVSNSTGKPADEYVPHQGADTSKSANIPASTTASDSTPAQAAVETAAAQGADAKIVKPESNYEQAKENGNLSTIENIGQQNTNEPTPTTSTSASGNDVPKSIYSSSVTGNEENVIKQARNPDFVDEQRALGTYDAVDEHLESSATKVHPHPKDTEEKVQPQAGEAIAVPASAEETRATHEEMSRISGGECPFLMNRE